MKDLFKAVISKGIKIVEAPVADRLKAKRK
jgi:hypothetical protein